MFNADDAMRIIQGLGIGALMAKLDLKDAYRIVPVHPDDRPLLGMRWTEVLHIDTVLPFGLRSAPKIFSTLADGLIWIMHLKGATPSLHYLHDFLLLGPRLLRLVLQHYPQPFHSAKNWVSHWRKRRQRDDPQL